MIKSPSLVSSKSEAGLGYMRHKHLQRLWCPAVLLTKLCGFGQTLSLSDPSFQVITG